MRALLLALTLLTTVSLIAQITPEERDIRETYAKLALASEIKTVHNAMDFPEQGTLKEQLAANRLDIRLSDFRVGNIKDVENDGYGNFVSRPVGGQKLFVVFEYRTLLVDKKYTYEDALADIKWVPEPSYQPVEWDTMTIGHVMDADVHASGHHVTRFASYTITVTFRNHTETRRASWFYGTDEKGQQATFVADMLTDNAIDQFRTKSVYPHVLLDDPHTRNNPMVGEWLNSVAQDCPGRKKSHCFDQTTGKAGISRDDIRRGPLVDSKGKPVPQPTSKLVDPLGRYSINQPCKGGDVCGTYTKTKTTPTVPDGFTTDHATGSHTFGDTFQGKCTYSGTSGTCSTSCLDTDGGVYVEQPDSTYTSILIKYHNIFAQRESGSAFTAYGGAECGAIFGGQVYECLDPGCVLNVTINKSGTGLGSSITFDPRGIDQDKRTDKVTCSAVSVSQYTAGGCSAPTAQQCYNKTNVKCWDDLTNTMTSCHGEWDDSSCTCTLSPWSNTPIIIHLGDNDNGQIELTSPKWGVTFPIQPGNPMQFSWTAAGSKDAFLVRDLNGNGLIDDGSEMFGNFTPQPPASNPNGFLALAEYDSNNDGVIDSRDSIYNLLRLWIDDNHDGVTQSDELHTLTEFGVQAIYLNYKETKYVDQYGNVFRYRGKVIRNGDKSFAYDVILATGN
jgi:hypothetical protein